MSKPPDRKKHLSVPDLRQQINDCFGADRGHLHRLLNNLAQTKNSLPEKALSTFNAQLNKSRQRVTDRCENTPEIQYPEELPVVAVREEICAAISTNQVVIICGETGSGKTTQLPKMCIELGRGTRGLIGHTQPRRIAARSVAARIAEEMNTTVGATVGYKVRFSDRIANDSFLKVMTDGILLAELQRDRWLNQYDTLIIDEAHERSLNIDFILGVLKQLLPRRPDLKLIITSATIDPECFSRHFDNAPIIRVSGRSYPVETRYAPLTTDATSNEQEYGDAIVQHCEKLIEDNRSTGGDILIFLPGERHIRECAELLGKQQAFSKVLRGVEVLPLFARLSASEQARIFTRHTQRRIVLATNVAETSLTVPGIHFVIDTGLARVSRYSLRAKVQHLPIEKISRAAADQRKGRCGRQAPGICVRLYSEEDFDARPEFTDPEILRTNLAAVVLQMASLRLGEVETFPFIEKPDDRLVRDGYQLLFELGAVTKKNELTKLGKKLAHLPVEPRFARMLFAAVDEHCVAEILTLASALSVLDPRERPQEKRQAADAMHAEFSDESSDFSSWLNLWAFIGVQRQSLSQNKFRKMCKARYLSYLRIREWQDVRKQLQYQCAELGLQENSEPADYASVHRALLSGLLGNVCNYDEKHNYRGTRNRTLKIFPGSSLKSKNPKWIIAAEVSETSQLFARGVAKIDIQWAERLAEHLLKHSYTNPRWEKKRGQVGATQKSTLYGLLINPGKRVNYGPLDPTTARDIFIRDALVDGQLASNAAFYRHNLQQVDEVLQLENKSRRRDILVSPEELVQFYDRLLPADIYTQPAFDNWRTEFERHTPRGLFFVRENLFRDSAEPVIDERFPNYLEMNGATFPLNYAFSPGSEEDGVTLNVPVAVLNRVDDKICDWLVPGLLQEKIVALIKSLPKTLRRNFVPAPDFAQHCLATFESRQTPASNLCEALASALSEMGNVQVLPDDFDTAALPAHLSMRFEIIDAHGKLLGSGRELVVLHARFADQTAAVVSKIVAPELARDNISDWNFGDLPESVEVDAAGGDHTVTLLGYPALLKTDEGIALRVLATKAEAQAAMHGGLRALYQRVLKNEHRYILKRMPGFDALCLIYTPFASDEILREDLANAAFDATFLASLPWPRRRDEFYQSITQHQKLLMPAATRLTESLDTCLRLYQQIARRIESSTQLSWVEPLQDIRAQLVDLFAPGFIGRAEHWLHRYPVYLQAVDRRLDAVDKSPEQDRRKRAEFLPLWEAFKKMQQSPSEFTPADKQFNACRWRFEELRVSLYAQSLGTIEKVSVKRLEGQLEKLRNG